MVSWRWHCSWPCSTAEAKDYATYEDEVETTHEHDRASDEEGDHDEVPVEDDSDEEADDAEDAEDGEPEGSDEKIRTKTQKKNPPPSL